VVQVSFFEGYGNFGRFLEGEKEQQRGLLELVQAWFIHSLVPPPRRTRDHHPRDEDLFLHPSEQKSFAGDPVSLGTPDQGHP